MTPVTGAGLPVLNATTFERTAAYLAKDAVAAYLQTIAERSEAVLQALAEPDALMAASGGLAEAAHMLAGSAGLFGFEQLTDLSRRFEPAARCRTADAAALANELAQALHATIRTIEGLRQSA